MRSTPTEFDVYQKLIEFLKAKGWTIVCASPPGGTDNRYRKCLLPRRELDGGEKGPRYEVDLTAHDNEIILLVECKPRLTQALTSLNALGESDYAKLTQIAKLFPAIRLAEFLHRATGACLPSNPSVALMLAVGNVDCEIPPDMSVIEVGSAGQRIWPVGTLVARLGIKP